MDKKIYHLRGESHPIETRYNVIIWLDWIGADCIGTPDLLCLVELYYFPN